MTKSKLVVLFVCLYVASSASNADETDSFSIKDFITFEVFKSLYNKTYSSLDELKKYKQNFEDNVKKIVQYNKWARDNDYDSRAGITEYTDLDADEFIATYTGFDNKAEDVSGVEFLNNIDELKSSRFFSWFSSSSWDWRDSKKVAPIKNQGKCGSCWTFSTASALESAYWIKYSGKPVLSEQNLLDCVSTKYGCNGGSPISAANYALKNGVMASANNPYLGYKRSSCSFSQKNGIYKPAKLYRWTGSESDLKTVVSKIGPVATAIYVPKSFQNYKSGVFTDNACKGITSSQVNHAVTIIGYGKQNGKDYWLFRNSWGTKWGDDGYFKLLRGSNHCGLMSQPFYFQF